MGWIRICNSADISEVDLGPKNFVGSELFYSEPQMTDPDLNPNVLDTYLTLSVVEPEPDPFWLELEPPLFGWSRNRELKGGL